MPPPPPAEGQVPRLVPAPCLRRACDIRATKGRRKAPPPHTHTSAPPKVGDEGREGRTAPPPPPEDKAARWGSSGERVRDGPHDRARRKHAPCKPQRGGRRGCERRVGRATKGFTRHAPPPCRGASAAPRACAMLATCLRQRTDSEDAPPPPSPPPTQERGEDTGETARGHGGGQRTGRRARGRDGRREVGTHKKKTKNQANQRAKGRRRGDRDQYRDERGEAGATWARKRRWRGTRPRGYGGPKGEPPPPCSQVPRPVLASCLRRACDMRATKGRQQGRPPPPPTHRRPPRGRAMTVAARGPPPPPEDKAAGWGGSGERVRDGPHDRAQREHAPCKPQRGGPPGVRPHGR